MRRVILESPYGGTPDEVARNVEYARRALKDSIDWNEAPLASHLLYTQVLDDDNPNDRAIGISAGHVWICKADLMVAYIDYGITRGMQAGIDHAHAKRIKVLHRKIGLNP